MTALRRWLSWLVPALLGLAAAMVSHHYMMRTSAESLNVKADGFLSQAGVESGVPALAPTQRRVELELALLQKELERLRARVVALELAADESRTPLVSAARAKPVYVSAYAPDENPILLRMRDPGRSRRIRLGHDQVPVKFPARRSATARTPSL